MRMELEKQRIEMERQRDEDAIRKQREVAVSHQSASIEVPTIQETMPSVMEVPTDILQVSHSLSTRGHKVHTHTSPQVRSKLSHPTNYHVNEIQKRQVRDYITQQQSRSAPSQQAGLGMGRGLGLGGSLMGMTRDPLLSGTGNHSPGMKPRSLNPNVGGSPMNRMNTGEGFLY